MGGGGGQLIKTGHVRLYKSAVDCLTLSRNQRGIRRCFVLPCFVFLFSIKVPATVTVFTFVYRQFFSFRTVTDVHSRVSELLASRYVFSANRHRGGDMASHRVVYKLCVCV